MPNPDANYGFTYRQLLKQLNQLTEYQLDKKVMALIDLEPWVAHSFHIGPKDDESYPNQPYFKYE